MTWFNKYGVWIVLIVAAAVAVAVIKYFKNKNVQDISFDFTLAADPNTILSNINSRYAQRSNDKSMGLYIDVPFTSMITNNSAVAKTLQNIMGSISYNGNNIMQTNANSPALANVPVGARSSAPISDSVQLLINSASINFISQLIKGNKPLVKYNFNATISGMPYQFSNSLPIKHI